MRTLERKTVDPRCSEFEQAYAGDGWLTMAGSTRVVDLQRTPKLRFEHSTVLGRETTIVCGTARKSKARNQLQMVPIGGGDIDLRSLVESMPDSDAGCVFDASRYPMLHPMPNGQSRHN